MGGPSLAPVAARTPTIRRVPGYVTGDQLMPSDDPPDLASGMTIWAVPGLVEDPEDPAPGAVAVLTVVPSVSVHTADGYPGADPVDVIASGLLGRGFALLVAPEVAQLVALPVLRDATAVLDEAQHWLRITDETAALYDGELAPVPPGWSAAVHRRGLLVVVISAAVDFAAVDRAAQVAAACAAGAVVGAQIQLAPEGVRPS